jgi:hypothetical protein
MNTLWRWTKNLGITAIVLVGLFWALKFMLIPRDVARKLEGLPPTAKEIGELCYAEGSGPWFNTFVEQHGSQVVGDALLALMAVPDRAIASCAGAYTVRIREFRAIPILEAAVKDSGTLIVGAEYQLEELRKLQRSESGNKAR